MFWVTLFIATLVGIGAAIALYEYVRNSTLLSHDFNVAKANQTEADREVARAAGAMRDRIMFDHMQ